MHKEHILAFQSSELTVIRNEDGSAEAFNSHGFTPAYPYLNDVLFNKMQYATEIVWRETAEFWPEGINPLETQPLTVRHRQIIPYALLTTVVDGIKMYAVYQRVKGVGEERLLRGHSLGFGGHLTGCYVNYDTHGGINVLESIYAGLAAEMHEEAQVDIQDGRVVTSIHGYIHSFISPVDALHLGVVMEVTIPNEYPYAVAEQGMVFKGFYPKEGLKLLHDDLRDDPTGFESWSRFIIDEML